MPVAINTVWQKKFRQIAKGSKNGTVDALLYINHNATLDKMVIFSAV